MAPTDPHPIPPTYWEQLAHAADAGQLFLSEDVAKACYGACVAYLERLDHSRDAATHLAQVEGFGDFESGKQLARIFSERAVGGPNNMVDVIDGHIRIVKEMQAVFQKFFTHYEDSESVNASEIAATGPN